MKIMSTTFLCDVTRCKNRITVYQDEASRTAAYLDLVGKAWKVQRNLTGWKHVCEDHQVEDLKP